MSAPMVSVERKRQQWREANKRYRATAHGKQVNADCQHRYREQNKDRVANQKRQYNAQHLAENSASHRRYVRLNRDAVNKWRRNYETDRYKEAKEHLFKILGGKRCSNPNCPIPQRKMNPLCLTFDHKNGGGRRDRARWKRSRQMLVFYASNPQLARSTLQVLCIYCNWQKHFDISLR